MPSYVFAIDLIQDAQEFQKNNPDGNKYELVRVYLKALNYFYANTQRSQQAVPLDLNNLEDIKPTAVLLNNLVLDNVNIRIARNLVKKFLTPDNGLILKVADGFVNLCDQQILINDQERALLESLYELQKNNQLDNFKKDEFIEAFKNISQTRHDSLGGLLESSLIVKTILISNKPTAKGAFVTLGITANERKKLLKQLDEFQGENFRGELREGQTFLEGSIASLREILEDQSWGVLK